MTPILKLKSNTRRRPIIGITMGDPCGIGPEIIAKSLSDKKSLRYANVVLVGDLAVLKKSGLKNSTNYCVVEPSTLPRKSFTPGKPNQAGAKASLHYLNTAVDLIKSNEIDALVTAPVCKETIAKIDNTFQGHTEHLAKAFRAKHVEMMFAAKNLRVVIVTRHLPLAKVPRGVTKESVEKTIMLTAAELKQHFRIKNPRLAVCGLNPHAGEAGTIGTEEIKTIIPAIKTVRRKKIAVDGPFAADTLFCPQTAQQYDAVIAMYHDQGLAPIKSLYFDELVNFTLGLPFVRTSPAHGTAFNIAGKNKANASSMQAAIQMAVRLSR